MLVYEYRIQCSCRAFHKAKFDGFATDFSRLIKPIPPFISDQWTITALHLFKNFPGKCWGSLNVNNTSSWFDQPVVSFWSLRARIVTGPAAVSNFLDILSAIAKFVRNPFYFIINLGSLNFWAGQLSFYFFTPCNQLSIHLYLFQENETDIGVLEKQTT